MERGRKRIIILLCCFWYTGLVYAQWTEADSLWLQRILSGKEELKLNPETLKQIESGTLINTDIFLKNQEKSAPAEIPLQKDFSEYILPESEQGLPDPWSMPPSVFMRYGLDLPLLKDKYNKAAFQIPQSIIDESVRPSGRSFDDMLQNLFSPSFRAKMRNRQNANAWKTY